MKRHRTRRKRRSAKAQLRHGKTVSRRHRRRGGRSGSIGKRNIAARRG